MRIVCVFVVMGLFIIPCFSQDMHETGELRVEATYDDFDPGLLTTGGLTLIGVFDDIEGNDTPVLEIEGPGGTENTWNESLGTNIETPENSEEVIWRFQYRIRVTDTPYQAQVRLQINQDPWTGFNTEKIIPEGAEEKWIFFDFLEGPFANFDYEELNFSLRFGAQQYQLFWLDDIRVYQSNALYLSSFESSVEKRFAVPFNAEVSFEDEDQAPEGFGVMNAVVTEPGSSIGDAGINLARVLNGLRYEGALRMTIDVRSADGPVELRGGVANNNTLDDIVYYAEETVRVEEADVWTTVSFLMPGLPTDEIRLFPFIQFGGQGNIGLSFDHLSMLKTDEEVEAPDVQEPPDEPVMIHEWSVF